MSLATVNHWVRHAQGQRLDRVDWHDRSRAPRHPPRTAAAIDDRVLATRRELERSSDLGFHGAEAIHDVLSARALAGIPTVRTINRILRRSGALDGQARVRRRPPPMGWYLPEVAAKRRELDCFDGVEGLVIKGGPQVEVLNGISLHGGLAVSWPRDASLRAKVVVDCLIEHWKAVGLPGYAQFDNDTIFQGTHAHPDVVGRVTRLCLGLGVVPVFVTPREPGFQAIMEGYNGTWQAKVWARFAHASVAGLQEQSGRHGGGASPPPCRPDRGGAAPACRPQAVVVGPSGSASWSDRLHQADQHGGGGRVAGPELRGGSSLVESSGPGGGGPRWRRGAHSQAQAPRAVRAAVAQAGEVPASESSIP